MAVLCCASAVPPAVPTVPCWVYCPCDAQARPACASPPAGFLPRQRQTLLFSATMPQAVQQVAGLALRSDYAFIDTVGQEEADTNIQVGLGRALGVRGGAADIELTAG